MKFTKSELKTILDRTKPFTHRKTPMNITEMIVFKSPDIVYATDIETSYQGRIAPVELNDTEINGTWEWAIPAKQLTEIVREMPGTEIEIIEEDKRWFAIKGNDGKTLFTIGGLDPDDFPAIEQPPDDLKWIEFKPSVFSYRIQKLCSLNIMSDEKRAHIKGILFQGSDIVSTNGSNLVIFDTKTETDFDAIVPKKSIYDVANNMPSDVETGQITFSEGNCYIKVGDEIFSIRCLEGDFPGYKAVIEIAGNDVMINFEDAKKFRQALKQASIMTSENYKACIFNMVANDSGIEFGDSITITTTNPDIGEGKVELDLVGCEFKIEESLEVSFNPINFLLLMNDFESVKVQGSGDKAPYLVTGERDDLTTVIMPMKV